jgi:hypothetical protein
MATIQQHRRTNIGNGAVSLNVTAVDNELTIALNGVQLAQLTGPGGFSGHTENLAAQLKSGEPNVLVVSLANYNSGGFNPWSWTDCEPSSSSSWRSSAERVMPWSPAGPPAPSLPSWSSWAPWPHDLTGPRPRDSTSGTRWRRGDGPNGGGKSWATSWQGWAGPYELGRCRERVVAAVCERRMELLEAATHFRRLKADDEASRYQYLYFPGDSGDERCCRHVITCVREQRQRESPGGAARRTAELEQELTDYLRRDGRH